MPSLTTPSPNRITFFRGDTHVVQFALRRPDPADPAKTIIVNLATVSSALLTVKARASDTTPLVQKVGFPANYPGTDGLMHFEFEPRDTDPVDPGTYSYDIQVSFTDGRVYTMFRDSIVLREDVTNVTDVAFPGAPMSLTGSTAQTLGAVTCQATQPAPVLLQSGSGWISIVDINVSGGTASSKVYDDSPNNTILQSATISGLNLLVTVKSSAPRVLVNGTAAVLSQHASGGYYTGVVAYTISGSGNIVAQLSTPDGQPGALDTAAVVYSAPPTITALAFSGPYPGSQTELKAGDTYLVSGTTDLPCVAMDVQDFGAAVASAPTFASATSFSITVTIADRGTTVQSLVARMRARNAAGAYGPLADTSNTVFVNNLYPTASFGANAYPGGQQALKNSETATVAVTLTNASSVVFDSPNGDLSITAPTTISTPKTVTRIAGSYNVATNNLRATATRAANGAVTVGQTIVNIANVAPTVAITTPAARLRSGGNNGTAVQGYGIVITADQQLLNAPSLAASGGTFVGSFTGGPSAWTRTLNVHDNDAKGSYSFSALTATGLSGLVQNTIGSGATYVLGGFVARDVTFAAFANTASIGVAVVTYSKLVATTFTATNQPANRNATQGNASNLTDTFTVTALNANPTTVFWNDVAAASSNSGGTAQLLQLQETA